jgi:hypothetical protein
MSRGGRAVWWALLSGLLAVALYARPISRPMLVQDDFQILARSWTWEKTCAGLWVPNNEHAMPLGRLLTYAVVRLAGRPSALPRAAVLVGPLALLAGMALTYLLVRRELGHPFFGLLAMTLFGVTTVYQQAVYWFAASFSLLALDTMLLALLAAQRYRRTGHLVWLVLCVLLVALSPAWFASGILAGPLCALYLAARGPDAKPQAAKRIVALMPLAGTLFFLAVSLPRTAATILHLEHYGGQRADKVFDPVTGLGYTARALVDNLLLGQFGIPQVSEPVPLLAPVWLVVVVVPLLLVLLAWWCRPTRSPRLVLLGAGLIAGHYLLTYSARAAWAYGDLALIHYSRYHLGPQLGLVLLIAAGLSGREGRLFSLDPRGRLTRGQARFLAAIMVLFFLVHLPRSLGVYYAYHPGQHAALREVEEVDARCREHHLDADTAREALPPLEIPAAYTPINGYDFLWGSPDPRPCTVEEARRLLREPET